MAANANSKQVYKGGLQLPISRIRTIMKSSPDVENIGQDSLFLIAKAAELFIQTLAQRACEDSKGLKDIGYNHVAEVIQTDDEYDFLREILPRKVKVKDIPGLEYITEGDEEVSDEEEEPTEEGAEEQGESVGEESS
ncbi:Hypothetical predicted protein [Cloeon dipterum]|uniref:Chromatin accessibility complex protein 1 n=1 Tax=Cloeon dipterum TaxID=197152 RepID=A0A8S1CI09_9INSE|nr:Hypothetical predicted protein [Cloeon dipterum]